MFLYLDKTITMFTEKKGLKGTTHDNIFTLVGVGLYFKK